MENIQTISLEQATAEFSKMDNVKTFTLPSGITASFNANELTGRLLMKARKLSAKYEDVSLSVFVAAEVCAFDGVKKTAEDIVDMDMADVLTLEESILTEKKPQ